WEVTRCCDLACRHCRAAARKGPYEGEMSTDECIRFLDSLASMGSCIVILTGGEPMLNQSRLFEIMEAGREHGLTFYMSSNAYWAKRYDRAVEIVKQLKERGLVRLNLSADRFHLPYISNECNVNAARACREVGGIYVYIQVAVTRLDSDGTVERLLRELEGLRADIFVYFPQPMGRGQTLPKEIFFTSQLDKVFNRRCDQVFAPVVHPDGQVLSCCSIPSSYDYPQYSRSNCRYVYGNVFEESLVRILERIEADPLIKFLAEQGPGALVKRFGSEFEAVGYKLRTQYYSHCDLCTEVLLNPQLVQVVDGHLGPP
ncbi:MAG: radical SAM protein, partial [candidate division WOR-3 bacterium]